MDEKREPNIGLSERAVRRFIENNRLIEQIAQGFPSIDLSVAPKGATSPQPTAPVAPAPRPATSSAPTQTTGMSFDEALSRLRMVIATIPSGKRREIIPILISRYKAMVAPEDRNDLEAVAMSYLPNEDDESSAMIKRMLPIMLVLSLLRRD